MRLQNPKGETPMSEVMPLVQAALQADTGNGGKYILLATDGNPDFCDDGDPDCPVDVAVYQLQQLQAKNITTIVLGIKSVLSSISDATLQAFANAGAGQAVAPPFSGTPLNTYYACAGVSGWSAAATAAGVTGMQLIGTYASAGGNAPVFKPNVMDEAALTASIRSVLSGIKSCVFDLTGKIAVNLDRLSEAGVIIQSPGLGDGGMQVNAVPLVTVGAVDGWRMNAQTQLELVGRSCDLWRAPGNDTIDFNFPCDIITVVR